MSKKWVSVIVLAAVVVSGISLWRLAAAERERYRLSNAYDEAQKMLQQLGEERDHLNQSLGDARQTVEEQGGDLASFQQELEEVQQRLNETTIELASLQQERSQLREENSTLEMRLDEVEAEKLRLEARLSDLTELKLAIHEVKRKVWNQRLVAWRARIRALQEADAERLAAGNRGFVVQNGLSTLGSGPRLHVHVLEPQSE